MPQNLSQSQILVVDDDIAFLERLTAEALRHQELVLPALDGTQAQTLISDRSQGIRAIFVNPKVSHPSGLSVLRCAMSLRPSTPVYLIHDREWTSPISDTDFRRLGIREKVQKPLHYKQVLELVAPIALSFDAQEALRISRERMQFENLEEPHTQDFVAIRAEDFLSGTQSFFDVFLRLPNDKFLKLLKAGDTFTPDRLESYLKKGLTHFYIPKVAQETYLQYCDHLVAALLKYKDAPIDLKTTQTLNQGDGTLSFLKSRGLSEKNLSYATRFLNNTHDLVKQLRLEENGLFRGFFATLALYEHGVSTTLLASLLCNELEITMSKPVHTVGLAALMHDVGLTEMPKTMWLEDPSLLSAEEKKIYDTHAQVGATLLNGVRPVAGLGIDPATLQAVEFHHLRLGQSARDTQIAFSGRYRIAEIVEVCSEFSQLISAAQKNPSLPVTEMLESKILKHFSRQIAYAFRTAFFGNA